MKKIVITLVVFLIIMISLLIQINLLNIIPLFGVVANIGIVLIVGLSLMSGKLVGGLVGGAYGLLVDVIFGKIIGINILLYALMGILTGHISNGFSKDNKTSMVMVVSIATVLFELSSVSLLAFLQNGEINIIRTLIIIALEVVYNITLTLIFNKGIVAIGEMINKSKNSYYLL